MAATNPYPFDNDAYQKARTSLNYYVRGAWLAGASEEQIRSTIDEVFAEIESSPDGSIDSQSEPDFLSDPPSGVAEEHETEAFETEQEDSEESESESEEPVDDELPADEEPVADVEEPPADDEVSDDEPATV